MIGGRPFRHHHKDNANVDYLSKWEILYLILAGIIGGLIGAYFGTH